MDRRRISRQRDGFTRLAALVLLLIAVLGGGVLMASVARARNTADRTASQNNLRRLVLAIQDHAGAHNGTLTSGGAVLYPHNWADYSKSTLEPNRTSTYGPILFNILPFLKQESLFKSSLVDVGQAKVYAAWEVAGKPVKEFVAPGDPTADPASDRTSYLVNGLALPRRLLRKYPTSFTDGTSQTIFLTEGYSRAVDLFPGTDPTKPQTVDRHWWDDALWLPRPAAPTFQLVPPTQGASILLPQGFEEGGINVGMGDGSTRTLSPKLSLTTWYAACTPASDDLLGGDW